MLSLYPSIKPYKQHMLEVDKTHNIYIEECGRPQGMPILFLHGGPGAGCDANHRRFFDPERFRIILFDQRGCGRSTPHGELQHNTTQHLLDDIEKIRKYLHVEQWHLFGGSWGSTLALAYAMRHPKMVLSMILRGIFLARENDLAWIFGGGVASIYPDYWQDFLKPVGSAKEVVQNYYKILTGDNQLAQTAAAKTWSLFEARCATLKVNPELERHCSEVRTAISIAKLEAHYFMHNMFLKHELLRDVKKIANIPGVIVHGRYDMICPLDNAYTLHQAWPNSELHIVRDAGHSSSEPGITHALLHATNAIVPKK